jgi:hypothetical protein
MKKMILAASLVLSACGDEQGEVYDEVVQCEDFCKPADIKSFEFKSQGDSVCICNEAGKE